MKQTTDIQHIKALLDRFYQGETTPGEERVLSGFFCGENADIPAELAADAELFRSLASVSSLPDDIDLPDGLLERLDEITAETEVTEVPEVDPRPKFGRLLLKVAAAVAAAAVLVWAAVAVWPDRPTADQGTNLVAETQVDEPSDTLDEPDPVHDSRFDLSVPEAPAPEKPAVRPRRKAEPANYAQAAAPDPDDAYIEITDPEEAARIMAQISSLLSSNFNEADKAIADVGASIDTYRQISKELLQ